jgi:glycosyltransferase involved in cell wall biosynthesis
MPVISIIVPVYKVEPYLRRCLDSVLAQTFTDYECILVDDGSPDGCPAICGEYAAKDPRFKALHKENGGLSDARNAGIMAATGDWIVLLDSDDAFASDTALKSLSAIIDRTPAPVIFNSHVEVVNAGSNTVSSRDSVKATIDALTAAQFYKRVMSRKENLMAAWLFAARRDFLLKYRLFFRKGILHEDELWMPCLVGIAKTIAVNHGLFYAYRQARTGSITSSVSFKNLSDKMRIIEDLQGLIKSGAYKKKGKKILRWRCAQLWMGLFRQLKVIKQTDCSDYELLSARFMRLKYVLLWGRTIKYRLFFIIVLFADKGHL